MNSTQQKPLSIHEIRIQTSTDLEYKIHERVCLMWDEIIAKINHKLQVPWQESETERNCWIFSLHKDCIEDCRAFLKDVLRVSDQEINKHCSTQVVADIITNVYTDKGWYVYRKPWTTLPSIEYICLMFSRVPLNTTVVDEPVSRINDKSSGIMNKIRAMCSFFRLHR